MLSASDLPDQLLEKSYLQRIWWAFKLNVADYSYALQVGLTYYKNWHAAGGVYELEWPMPSEVLGGVSTVRVPNDSTAILPG